MDYHDIEQASRDLQREVAIMREENALFVETILSLVIGNSLAGTMAHGEIMDKAEALVANSRRIAANKVAHRHR